MPGDPAFGKGAKEGRDILGRIYEYFIKEFARAEGHRGGEFFTPGPVARLLVEMLQPFQGRVLDPACGSCGLFVQSGRFIEAHGGNPDKISIYGQERNQATWRIGLMNLAIHGFAGEVRYTEAGSLLDDAFPSLKADFVMANPPFNQKEWSTPAILDDSRWRHGTPPESNANYAWIQHFLHHLAPDGRAGFVMANGSLTTAQSGEGDIREGLIRDDVIDCIVALPPQLFYTTGIPVCLWFLDRDKASSGERDRRGETLFIDARQTGKKISRTQIELTEQEIGEITSVYHAWRGKLEADEYRDVPGFCKSGMLAEIESAGMGLSPGRYVGAPEAEEDEIEFEEHMATLIDELADQMAENHRLAEDVRTALGKVGYVVCEPLPVLVIDQERSVDEQQRVGDGVLLDPLGRFVNSDGPAGSNDASACLQGHNATAVRGPLRRSLDTLERRIGDVSPTGLRPTVFGPLCATASTRSGSRAIPRGKALEKRRSALAWVTAVSFARACT